MLSCFINSFLCSQNRPTEISRDSILSMLHTSSVYFETADVDKIEKGLELINSAEKIIETNGYNDIKVWICIIRAEFYLANYDFVSAELFVKNGLNLIESENNDRALGKLYEISGIIDRYKLGPKQARENFVKACYYLDKSKIISDRIDVNYNLSNIYSLENDWGKVEEHALKAIEAINHSKVKQSRLKYLKCSLVRCYLEKGNLTEAKAVLDELDTLTKDDNGFFFNSVFNEAKGLYFLKVNNQELANKHLYIALEYNKKERVRRTKKLGKSLASDYELKHKEEQNKQLKKENEFNNTIVLYSFILIALLLITIYLQYYYRGKEKKFNKILKEKNQKLIQANLIAKESVKAKSVFLDIINHELRTPLSTVKGIVHLLKSEELTPYQREQIDVLNFSADHLILLINNIIDLSTINDSKINLKFEAFNLKKTLNNLISSVVIKNIENNNTIHRDIDANIPDEVIGDALKLSQVFINLIGNAIKFTESGDIYITAKLIRNNTKKAAVYFEVKDTGIGIKDEYQEAVFESFNQGDEATNKVFGGTGLGLTIVKRIVEMHGGKIELKSKEEEGTSFSFIIEFDVVKKANSEDNSIRNHLLELFKEQTLLLVEDNRVNRLITEKILLEYGFNCLVAKSGEEAIEIVKNKEVNIVLMDVMLPGIDGFEATKAIKQINENITVLGLTAIDQVVNDEKFKTAGFESIVQKPIKPEGLIKQIANVIDFNPSL